MKTTMRGSSRMATIAPTLMAMGALSTLHTYIGQGQSGMAIPDARRDKAAQRAAGGYGSQGKGKTRGKENARRERIWFSPHCLKPQGGLFADATETEAVTHAA